MQPFLDTVYFVSFNLTKAILAPIMRDSFIFWPFLLSTAILAPLAWAYWMRLGQPINWRNFRERFLCSGLWWHPSARADYRLYFVNALVIPALFGFLLFNYHDAALLLDGLLGYPSSPEPASSWAWKLGFTIAFFVAYDFGRFAAHSLLHDIPLLWEFHKVHHSASVLTPMTAYRVHPVDLLVMAWGSTLATGIAAWLVNHLAGAVVDAYLFMGLHVLIWGSNLVGNLRHTRVWFTYGPALGKWLISPAHHQLHHSCEKRHYGCNRGFDLAIWDRFYGTLYVPSGPEESFEIGLDDGTTGEWHSVRYMLLQPFKNAAKVILGHKPAERGN